MSQNFSASPSQVGNFWFSRRRLNIASRAFVPAFAVLLMGPDWRARSFDAAVESTKQLITLETGIIALGITFSKDFAVNNGATAKNLFALSWIFFGVAIVLGIFVLQIMAGNQSTA